jgi:hypothetical protein
MLSRRWSGTKLITSQIALEIARLVHKEGSAEADLELDEPLSVTEDGDAWIISGARSINYDPGSPVANGSLRMRISQFDGQILSYVLAMTLRRPDISEPTTDKR